MWSESQHEESLKALYEIEKTIRGEGPISGPIAISASLAWIVDYRERKHIYLFAANSMLLTVQEYGTFNLPADTWTLFDMPPGARVFAPNFSTSTILLARYTNENLSAQPSAAIVDGLYTTVIAAGVTTDTVIKASAGRLASVLITAAGTNQLNIFDNATQGSGVQIGLVAASAAAGTVSTPKMPAANGITVQGNSNNPAVTIAWS